MMAKRLDGTPGPGDGGGRQPPGPRDEGGRQPPGSPKTTGSSGLIPAVRESLVTDLWFYWDGDLPSLEIQLVTIDGTIAGSYPKRVTKGERLPIHRKYVRVGAASRWYVRIAGAAVEVMGVSVAVELTDRADRIYAMALWQAETLPPRRTAQIERDLLLPESLDPLSA